MKHSLPDWARDGFSLETMTLNDSQVPFLVAGHGVPVVMVHGLSGSLDWWQYNAPALAEHFRVYLLDLPGFGRLGHLSVCDSMRDYVDWLGGWASGIGLEHVYLIGHSMGGHIGLRLAAERADLVRKLVLVAPAGVVPATELPHYVLPLLRLLRDIPVALLPLAIRDVLRSNLRTVWRSSHDLIEVDLLDTLGSVQSPTLVVWGEEDPVLPFAFARWFQEAIPGAELYVIPNAGHIPMIDEPRRFNARTIAFLKDQSFNSWHSERD